jgi:hypothetical protein
MKCALCLQDTQLCDSHIYPEFLYRKVYEEDHSFYVLSNDPNSRPKLQRKGIYEQLLCESCEKHINVFEDYAAKVLFGGVPKSIEYKPDRMIVRELDYSKFKLFQLSLLWRSSVSRRPELNNVNLGPHEEILRRMISESRPGEPHEYGSSVSFIQGATDVMQRFLYPLEPLNQKIRGFQLYRGVFGGLFWAFVVSSHSEKFPFQEVFISKEGVLQIFKAPPSAQDFLFDLGKDMAGTIKKITRRNA